MLVADNKQGWSDRVNFTDSNDVFVGFDMSGYCCEVFGWYVSKEVTTGTECEEVKDFEGYIFDIEFFQEIENGEYDKENYAVFKLIKPDSPELYLHLYNHHNGYYSHGFTATVKGETWKDGVL